MIKQDYLIRMIQEIISLIINAILNKKKIRKQDWVEYDCLTRQILGIASEDLIKMDIQELTERYEADTNKMEKLELAAMTMLKISDETENDNLLLKSKLRQDGLQLLKNIQKESNVYSIQRDSLINLLEMNS